jgi:hypothetical protein
LGDRGGAEWSGGDNDSWDINTSRSTHRAQRSRRHRDTNPPPVTVGDVG